MDGWGALFIGMEFAAREAAALAGAGFLLLGASNLLIDLIWICGVFRRRMFGTAAPVFPDTCAAPADTGWTAVFIPAWQEDGVIAEMLCTALDRLAHPRYRLYVGCYSNDPETIAAVRSVVDPRIRLVICAAAGPTTKADCLNYVWQALMADERIAGQAKAVVLHDAEDIVHSGELHLFDALIGRFDMVQLPVLPLIDEHSRWVAGHYADEFAESHGKELIVRMALGAALPSAGVGCAFSRTALGEIAAGRPGPFDPDCLTEDYELGLRLHAMGRRGIFVPLRPRRGAPAIVTREYFPATVDAAVRQKARWMAGIALAGWDRLGWSGSLAERWMRLRDRQSVLAAILLVSGYLALALFVLLEGARIVGLHRPAPLTPAISLLLAVNFAMLGWRLAMRWLFVTRAYGWREGLRAIPRVVVSNIIAMMAARRALTSYLGIRRTGLVQWDKTRHAFPQVLPAE
ncbi:glycosyl transferase family protein [Allosphingosinicella indica]|uniref:Adsorption protein B n=1 Tax=Allosphingosinicella indica TaxID=941907 RepID=A0A1X7G0F6_9SPHN|nr:glycosyl transferase family protein [Allosphingosinicella indica]SMF61850.1 adsorption protein B [Allosphingosinicella indica]